MCNRDSLESRVRADGNQDVANVIPHRFDAQMQVLRDLTRRTAPLE